MNTRLPLALGLVLAFTPASVAAQVDGSPAPLLDDELVDRICASTTADPAELDACVSSIASALEQLAPGNAQEEQTLLDRAASIVDDTLEDLRQIDVETAFDDLVQSAQEIELDFDLQSVQQALDDAVAEAQTAIEELDLPNEVDIQTALDEAVAEALAAAEDFDLQGAVDGALADAQTAIEEADVQGVIDETVVALEGSVETARAVVTEAQQWALENRNTVCRGGSISLGTTVGVAVFVLTGVEWLGLQAFWATERLTNGICGDVVGE